MSWMRSMRWEKAVGVEIAAVAGMESAVDQRRRRLFGPVPTAEHRGEAGAGLAGPTLQEP